MTSAGPSTPFMDYSHMYSFVSKRQPAPLPVLKAPAGTILDFLQNNPETKQFLRVLMRSNHASQYADPSDQLTLFVPLDRFMPKEEAFYANLDPGIAWQMVAMATLPRDINGYLVTSSPFSYYTTLNPDQRMFVSNVARVTSLNDCARVVSIDAKKAVNGRVHYIDAILKPTDCTFLN